MAGYAINVRVTDAYSRVDSAAEASGTVTTISLGEAMAAYEKDLLQDALKTTHGVRSKAARLLNTTDRIFNYKVQKYGIDYRRFLDRRAE